MNYHYHKIFSVLAICLGLLSCEKEKEEELSPCSYIDPVTPETTFTLVDSNGAHLIGADRIYHPDTLAKYNEGDPFIFSDNSPDFEVLYYFGGLNSGEESIFRLSESDTDTVAVFYLKNEGECFPSIKITEFRYNGKLIEPGQPYAIYEIAKK